MQAGLFPVVEMNFLRAQDLVIFVTLARDEHTIPRLRQLNGGLDGGGANRTPPPPPPRLPEFPPECPAKSAPGLQCGGYRK